MIALPLIAVGEAKVITFDFTDDIPAGSTATFVSLTKTTIGGTDPGAAGLTLGTPFVSGRLLMVLATPTVDKAVYFLLAKVSAPNGAVTEFHECPVRLPIGLPAR